MYLKHLKSPLQPLTINFGTTPEPRPPPSKPKTENPRQVSPRPPPPHARPRANDPRSRLPQDFKEFIDAESLMPLATSDFREPPVCLELRPLAARPEEDRPPPANAAGGNGDLGSVDSTDTFASCDTQPFHSQVGSYFMGWWEGRVCSPSTSKRNINFGQMCLQLKVLADCVYSVLQKSRILNMQISVSKLSLKNFNTSSP